MLALYRDVSSYLDDHDPLSLTYTTGTSGVPHPDSADYEVVDHQVVSEWYESEGEREAMAELGINGEVVGVFSVRRWVGTERPAPRDPTAPFPFVSLVRGLARELLHYPDAEEHVRPHLLRLRTREGARAVIDALDEAERTRQAAAAADEHLAAERARAAWWRSEHPLLVASVSTPSDEDAQAVRRDRLTSDRPYVNKEVARMLYNRTARSLAEALRSLESEVGEGRLNYPNAKAMTMALNRVGVNVKHLKEKGEAAVDNS